MNRRPVHSATMVIFVLWTQAVSAQPAQYEARWTDVAPKIDGHALEAEWDAAQLIDRFTLPWLGDDERPARTSTRARLLWDAEYLYFFAALEDNDLFADVTEHDGKTWFNDVFEIFLKPDPDQARYYEFQVNSAGTTFDMYIPQAGLPNFVDKFVSADEFHLEAKVTTRGTLDKRTDRDDGWSVEGRIPWSDFSQTGGGPEVGDTWRFALCRYDYNTNWARPELSTCAPLDTGSFHQHEDYVPLRFVGAAETPISLGPDHFGTWTTSRVVGSPEPPLPYRVARTLEEYAIEWPVSVVREPDSRRLLLITASGPYGTTYIQRTPEDSTDTTLETLLTLEDEVVYSICFHPRFAENGYLYLGGNGARDGGPKQTRVTRYTVGREAPHAIDPESALIIFECESDGHNGAAIAFGNDGMLYITTGDGTSDSDDDVVGQRLDLPLAKVLRIDVEHSAPDRAYSVPADNPFVGQDNVVPETWAYGFRNPWRMTVDPETGRLWVAQNGQDLWEQAYAVRKGANYGWSVYEGSHPFYLNRELGPTPVSPPTFEHPHSEARSLTGGVVYYGERLPELRGAYVYGDYSTGKIWAGKLDEDDNVVWHREIADSMLQITSFGIDADGELLITDHQGDGKGGLYTLEVNDTPSDPAAFPRTLSETGLFSSVAQHTMASGVIPYDVNSPLWSDGALKARYLAIPADAEGGITFHPHKAWDFPNGTVLVKSFALELQESRRWIETRLLTKQQNEWVGYSYEWNDEQTDATLVPRGGVDREFAIHSDEGGRRLAWRYPSRTECMVCHSRAAAFVLGLSTPQLNREYDYAGVVRNQLQAFTDLGLVRLDRHPDEYERLAHPADAAQPLEARARSYLHANCAQCHVAAGGGNAQMELSYRTPIGEMKVVDVAPLHHTFGIDRPRLIAPGDPDRSVLLHRVSATEPGRMPQLATNVPDTEAIELLRDWIAGMDASESSTKGDAP